jgi:inhibitor of KinA
MNEYMEPRILLCGDTGVSVEFGKDIDPDINHRVQELFKVLGARRLPGVLGLNPTYRSLFIQYDPWLCSFERLLLTVEDCLKSSDEAAAAVAPVVEVPVCYGGEYGPDLDEVASFHGMSPEEVVRLHCASVYYVYMIGFTPGFAYLGGLDERLHTPRKKEPRKVVPAGSVGIADRQTGIYPIDSPGGWQLIGKTPVQLFDLEKDDPFLIHAGQSLKFKAITREEFENHRNS